MQEWEGRGIFCFVGTRFIYTCTLVVSVKCSNSSDDDLYKWLYIAILRPGESVDRLLVGTFYPWMLSKDVAFAVLYKVY